MGAIQSIFQILKPNKRKRKNLLNDLGSGTDVFNNVSKSHYIKRKKLQRAKRLDEALKGFFIAVIFLVIGTLIIMYLGN